MFRFFIICLLVNFFNVAYAEEMYTDQELDNYGYIAKIKADGGFDFISNKNSMLSNWNANLRTNNVKLKNIEIVKEKNKYYLIASGEEEVMNVDLAPELIMLTSVIELVNKDNYLYVTPYVCTTTTIDEISNVRPKKDTCIANKEDTFIVEQPHLSITKKMSIIGVDINYKMIKDYLNSDK